MRWGWIFGLSAVALVCTGLVGCAAVLPAVKLDPALGPPAPPPVLGAFEGDAPVTTVAQWEARRRPLLQAAFAREVYGPYPTARSAPHVVSNETIAYPRLPNATVEQWQIAVQGAGEPLVFNMMVVLPKDARGPTPLIVMENFCGNRAAFRDPPAEIKGPLTEVLWACDAEWAAPLVEGILGRHISVPPYEDVLAHGYGLAMFYAGDVVADEPVAARQGLRQLYGDRAHNAGAVAVWAWLYSAAIDTLSADTRVDAHRIAVWGHSRNGKAALLAGAMDPRIAAVIAHQSGRGGASLSTGTDGESIAKLREAFPHWFSQAWADAPREPEMDQHQLLALIAPRPVLLGNGARDAWADPHAAWRAAQAADPVYRLYGVTGFAQDDMRAPNSAAQLEYFTRPGVHGVTTEDWRQFLAFLDTHMK